MIIPWKQIDPVILHKIIESFVLREGTDYGEKETSLQQKVTEVLLSVKAGEAVLVWSELHASINIMLSSTFRIY